MLKIPLQILRGFAMGAADVVPGVSGGTVALVLGIYARLIDTVRDGALALGRLAKLDFAGAVAALRAVQWSFILPLAAGIGLAVLSLSHTIERLLDEQPVRMAGLFLGLVLGSIAVTAQLVKRDRTRLLTFLGVAAATFLVLGFRSGPVEDPVLPFVFLAGAIAICAMILPGISGSFLLLMMGMYDYVLGAVNQRDLLVVAVFGLGAVLGLAGFSSLLHWALHKHNNTVMAALIGLMTGSLRVLWPWPEGTGGTSMAMPADDVAVPILLAIGAAIVVVIVARMASAREQRAEVDHAGVKAA